MVLPGKRWISEPDNHGRCLENLKVTVISAGYLSAVIREPGTANASGWCRPQNRNKPPAEIVRRKVWFVLRLGPVRNQSVSSWLPLPSGRRVATWREPGDRHVATDFGGNVLGHPLFVHLRVRRLPRDIIWSPSSQVISCKFLASLLNADMRTHLVISW